MGTNVWQGTLLAGPLVALSSEQEGIAAWRERRVGRLHGPDEVEEVHVLADEGAVQVLGSQALSWKRVRRADEFGTWRQSHRRDQLLIEAAICPVVWGQGDRMALGPRRCTALAVPDGAVGRSRHAGVVAERVGFEPTGLAPGCFQDSYHKPLGHLSREG